MRRITSRRCRMPHDPTGNFQPLAAHTIDIQFLFDKWHGGQLGVNLDQTSGQPRELQGPEITLSDQLVAAWTNFAKTGNPNGPGASRVAGVHIGLGAVPPAGHPQLGPKPKRNIEPTINVTSGIPS